MSSEAADLLREMLHKKPNSRITIDKIKSHAFFRDLDWEKLQQKQLDPPVHLTLDDEEVKEPSEIEDEEELAFLQAGQEKPEEAF